MTPPTIPAPRPSFIAYAIVDVSTTPPTPVGVEMSRKEARTEVDSSPFAEKYRIRRARVQLYNK